MYIYLIHNIIGEVTATVFGIESDSEEFYKWQEVIIYSSTGMWEVTVIIIIMNINDASTVLHQVYTPTLGSCIWQGKKSADVTISKAVSEDGSAYSTSHTLELECDQLYTCTFSQDYNYIGPGPARTT